MVFCTCLATFSGMGTSDLDSSCGAEFVPVSFFTFSLVETDFVLNLKKIWGGGVKFEKLVAFRTEIIHIGVTVELATVLTKLRLGFLGFLSFAHRMKNNRILRMFFY